MTVKQVTSYVYKAYLFGDGKAEWAEILMAGWLGLPPVGKLGVTAVKRLQIDCRKLGD